MAEIKHLLAIFVLLSLIIGSSMPAFAQTSSQKTMLENMAGIRDFSTLVGAVRAAGLDGVLNGATPYTVFAPSNAAFNKIPSGTIQALANDKAALGELIKYHVVPGKVTYADLTRLSELSSVDGKAIPIGMQDGVLTVGGVKIVDQGIDSKNGIVYKIDNVLTPPGFVMPQVARSQGVSWGWLPWVLGGLALGGLLLYLLTRPRKVTYEEPRRYAEPERKVSERSAEETMRKVRETVSAYREPSSIMEIAKNLDLPLSGAALAGLNALINKGTFKDKSDFMNFLVKTYMDYDVGSLMTGGKEPGVSTIMDIISKTGIAKGFMDDDIKKQIVPLLLAGFMAVYNYFQKKPAVKPA